MSNNNRFDQYMRDIAKNAKIPLQSGSLKAFKWKLFKANFMKFSFSNFTIFYALLLIGGIGLGTTYYIQNQTTTIEKPIKQKTTFVEKSISTSDIIQNSTENESSGISENSTQEIDSDIKHDLLKEKNTTSAPKVDTVFIKEHKNIYDTVQIRKTKTINKTITIIK